MLLSVCVCVCASELWWASDYPSFWQPELVASGHPEHGMNNRTPWSALPAPLFLLSNSAQLHFPISPLSKVTSNNTLLYVLAYNYLWMAQVLLNYILLYGLEPWQSIALGTCCILFTNPNTACGTLYLSSWVPCTGYSRLLYRVKPG